MQYSFIWIIFDDDWMQVERNIRIADWDWVV